MPFHLLSIASDRAKKLELRALISSLRKSGYLFLIPLLLVAFLLRYHPNNSGIPSLSFMRPDEFQYVLHVIGFLNHDFEVQYFINPSLYMYVLYALTCVVGQVQVLTGAFESFEEFVVHTSLNPHVIMLTGRILSISVSTASVALVFVLAKRLFSTPVALLSAAALATNYTHMRRAPLTGNESLMVFLILAFFLLLCYYHKAPSWKRHALCGFMLGLACAVKYNAAIHAVPLFVVSCLAVSEATPSGESFRRRITALMKPRYSAGYLFLLSGFLIGSPSIILYFDSFISGFSEQYSFLHAGYVPSDMEKSVSGYIYYLKNFPELNNGWLFGLFCGIGVVMALYLAVFRREHRSIILLSAIVPLYLFLGTGVFSLMRFLLPVIPLILILGALAFVEISVFIARRSRILPCSRPLLRNAFFMVMATAILLPGAVKSYQGTEKRFGETDSRKEITSWVINNIENHDGVVDLDLTMGFPFSFQRTVINKYESSWRDSWSEEKSLEKTVHTMVPLVSLIVSSRSLDELINRIHAMKLRKIIVFSRIGVLFKAFDFPKNVHSIASLDCSYWSELVKFLADLPIAEKVVSHDGTMIMVMLEFPEDD